MADDSNASGGGGFQSYAGPSKPPGFIENEDLYVFEGFEGLNTKPSRLGIQDQQMAWCDNWFPLGPSNLRAGYGMADSVYTAAGGKTIKKFVFFVLGPNATEAKHYCIIFLSDGSCEIYDIDHWGVLVDSLPAATFTNPVTFPGALPGVNQYGRDYLLIVNDQTNGYWIWNGTKFFTSGGLSPNVTILQDGFNYTSTPTIAAFGGSGTGATFSSTISAKGVATITVTNPGTGYVIGDLAILTFTGGGGSTTATGTATLTGGTVTGIAVVAGGTGYNSASTKVTLLGGGGAGATATATVAAGVVTGFTVTAPGSGYITPPAVLIQDTANNIAVAWASIMPFGVSGTTVEVFSSRVWIGNDANVLLSAAGSVSDFSPTDGGGAFRSTDSFLREHYTLIKQAKGLLYLFADSSTNYVTGVGTQVFGTIATTTFNNINVDPQVGTSWPESVQAFGGAEIGTLIFGNSYGVHALYGGQIRKVSAELDGIYFSVPQDPTNAGFSGFYPSSACAQIFGINVYMMLMPIIDPYTKVERRVLLCWNGKKWFTANQEINLIYVGTLERDSTISAWGTDGKNLRQMFAQPSAALRKIVKSKLWNRPSYIVEKKANRFWAVYEADEAAVINFGIDNQASPTFVQASALPYANWVSNEGPAYWASTIGPALWQSGVQVQLFLTDIDTSGYVLGITVDTNVSEMTLISTTAGFQQMTQYI